MTAEPPYDVVDGVSLGSVSFDKKFTGGLEEESHVNMIGARTKVESSAGYVAMERVTGVLDGKRGTFVRQHTGTMNRAGRSHAVTVVPDSATGELEGLSGRMDIQTVDGKHFYEIHYETDR